MRGRGRAHRGLAAAVVLAASLAALVVLFPPDRFPLYPACPFHALTGLLCPGCGMTRALAALLTGRVAAAWRLNPLLFVVLPVAAGFGAAAYWRALRGYRRVWPSVPAAAIYVLLGLVACFTVARNFA